MLTVTPREFPVVSAVFKQSRKIFRIRALSPSGFIDPLNQRIQIRSRIFLRHQRCSHRYVVLRILWKDHLILRQTQSFDKTPAKFRQEGQRSPQESHIAADHPAARQTADRLVHHRLKDRYRQIFMRRAFVDQRLNIGLCEHAAARRDGIDRLI